MTRYFAITFIVATSVFLISYTRAACGPNEVERKEKDCASDCCPEPACAKTACPNPCGSKCKCGLMYLRARNGTCISARDCPEIPCGDNEYFERCPNTFCSEECSDNVRYYTDKRCHVIGRIGTTVICRPACRCIDNYWRSDDGQCVYYDECPQLQTNCD